MTKKTILIVDDSSTMRRIIARELVAADYEVIEASNGMEALSIIEWMKEKPDLITLDIDMPVMGGFEVCEQLFAKRQEQKDTNTSAIPIIFVSAVDTLKNRRRGFQLEVTEFISKPFQPNDISKAVNRILFPQEQFSGMNALVVDDSSSVRRIIKKILVRIGIKVFTASNGLEAIHTIEANKNSLDLIIIDYMMPEMMGDELCNIIRQQPILNQVPLFMISAFDDMELILTLFKIGATDYLCKPFIEEELLARVESHLRARTYVKKIEELNKKLEIQATHDALTGLYNRHFFQDALESSFTTASNHNSELCCILFDMDFFKKINDTYGHAVGDLVLKETSALLRRKSRKSHICARYGGEEFILLLPDTNLKSAATHAAELLHAVAQHSYKNEEHCCQVTCSIGISSFIDHHPGTGEKLVSMADEALYCAKKNGRNKVCVYPDILFH